ncbi:MAG: serine/threonine protein kinase [Myxococcales bacterium]|nr:serine/threonine protein kinase [Myxococcales bacterium]
MDEPQRLGEYELVSRLGAGGMATLYVARHPGSAMPVAIKVVHGHLTSDWEAMRWFIDEALITIRIRHPNVVRVDELGEQDGVYYLVMEYVHGASLAQLLAALAKAGRRLNPWLSAWIVARVAEGLHAAHELRGDEGELLGVVHRDISPQNILLSHDGDVKLADFGIAKAKGRAERTREGEIRGKIRYLAPEQVVGGPQDRRVDVFALGVVLWEMLTQRRLYAGLDQNELLEAVKDPRAERPSRYQPGIPPGLEGIVLNTIGRAPEDRPQTADVLVHELDELLRGAPADFDGRAALTALMRDVLGSQLLEALRALPPELAAEAGLDTFEPTVPRIHRADGRPVASEERGHSFAEPSQVFQTARPDPSEAPPAVGGQPAASPGTRAPKKKSDTALWVLSTLLALAAFVAAGIFLLRD